VSEQLPAPLQIVCRVAGVSRSAACEARRRRGTSEPPRRRPGPVGAMTDSELLSEIRDVLATSPFVGEGHRKVWARLRRRGVCTARKRVLRLTREAGLLAPTAKVRKRAARLHDGTITVTVPDTLWATDATEGFTEEGRCAVFVMIDHASGEAWADAGLRMDRFAAADLLREVTTERFGYRGDAGQRPRPVDGARRGRRQAPGPRAEGRRGARARLDPDALGPWAGAGYGAGSDRSSRCSGRRGGWNALRDDVDPATCCSTRRWGSRRGRGSGASPSWPPTSCTRVCTSPRQAPRTTD